MLFKDFEVENGYICLQNLLKESMSYGSDISHTEVRKL